MHTKMLTGWKMSTAACTIDILVSPVDILLSLSVRSELTYFSLWCLFLFGIEIITFQIISWDIPTP